MPRTPPRRSPRRRQPPPNPRHRLRALRVLRLHRRPPGRRHHRPRSNPRRAAIGATLAVISGNTHIGSRSRSTGRISIGIASIGTGYPGHSASDGAVSLEHNGFGLNRHRRSLTSPRLRGEGEVAHSASIQTHHTQIQFWKIISRLKVSIDVPTNAAEIGSIAAKPANATATKPHSSQRGLLPRRSA